MNVDTKLIEHMKEMLKGYPSVERATLFGSRARGDNRERSDYDIAIYGTLSPGDRARLRLSFEEDLPTLHKIDVIFMQQHHDDEFTKSIHRDEVPFYEKVIG